MKLIAKTRQALSTCATGEQSRREVWREHDEGGPVTPARRRSALRVARVHGPQASECTGEGRGEIGDDLFIR